MTDCEVCFEKNNHINVCNRCKFRICENCFNNNREIISKNIYLNTYRYVYCSLSCVYLQLTNHPGMNINDIINEIIYNSPYQWFTQSIHNHQKHLYNVIYIDRLSKILVNWFIKDIGKLIVNYCKIDD